MAVVIRKSWPRIIVVKIKGETFYRVDARRQGTSGKREHFTSREQAEKRARELDNDQRLGGDESLSLSPELRFMALKCAERLAPFGKTLEDATTQFIKTLKRQEVINQSRFVGELADEWIRAMETDGKPRTEGTLDDLRKHRWSLKRSFPEKKIAELTPKIVETALWKGKLAVQTRKNLRTKWGQFFNWAIKNSHCQDNPCKAISIKAYGRDIERYSAKDVESLMALAESKYADVVPYLAICTFAGVRPFECERLTWNQISFEHPDIEVKKSTLMVKDRTRFVPMSKNLMAWLRPYAKKHGRIIQPNLRKRMDALKIEFGFKLKGENATGRRWIPDGLRHTYASFWLAQHPGQVAQLSYQMGNTAQVIADHYNRAVRKGEIQQFWSIRPKVKQKKKLASAPA